MLAKIFKNLIQRLMPVAHSMDISFHGKKLKIDNRTIETPCEIAEILKTKEGIVVRLEPFVTLSGRIYDVREVDNCYKGSNLLCYSKEGILRWEAEFPRTNEDYYYQIESECPLRVFSFSSYLCEIDIRTGKIVTAEFYK
jgi:hypothetical protein